MTATYDLIASNVLSSSASSVTFSSIPATYRDLIIVVRPISTSGTIIGYLRFNSDSGANYNWVRMSGDGSSATSFSTSDNGLELVVARTSDNGQGIAHIMDYSATDKHKSVLQRLDDPTQTTRAYAGRWANTSAINSVTVAASSNQFASGATFYLYGIVS